MPDRSIREVFLKSKFFNDLEPLHKVLWFEIYFSTENNGFYEPNPYRWKKVTGVDWTEKEVLAAFPNYFIEVPEYVIWFNIEWVESNIKKITEGDSWGGKCRKKIEEMGFLHLIPNSLLSDKLKRRRKGLLKPLEAEAEAEAVLEVEAGGVQRGTADGKIKSEWNGDSVLSWIHLTRSTANKKERVRRICGVVPLEWWDFVKDALGKEDLKFLDVFDSCIEKEKASAGVAGNE